MKKITLLLSFIACVAFTQAQTNLVSNPGFETWTDGTANNWTVNAASATVTQASNIVKSGNSSLKQVVAANAASNPGIVQVIPATVGKTYTISFWYYVEAGDDSDIRIWSSWKNGATFVADKTGMQPADYAPSNKGNWTQFTLDVTAPATTTDLALEIRTYKGSTIYLDDIFFGEKTTGFNSVDALKFKAFVVGNDLQIKNVANGATVEIFSALGSKVQTSVLENGKVSVDNLSRGMYIVRVGKNTQKFML